MSFPGSVLLSPKSVVTTTTVKRHRFGTRGQTTDGRVFRYAKAGATVTKGRIVTAKAQGDMAYDTNTAPYTDTGWTTTWNHIRLSTTWASPGGSTGVTKDLFADGYAWTGSTEGYGGQVVTIKSNTTGATSAASQFTVLTFQDESRWSADFDSETRIGVIMNPYNGVIVQAGGALPTTLRVIGVAPCTVASGSYFWLQTWGPAAVIQVSTNLAVGDVAVMSSSTGVARCTSTDVDVIPVIQNAPKIGYVLAPQTSDGDFMLLQLTIDP